MVALSLISKINFCVHSPVFALIFLQIPCHIVRILSVFLSSKNHNGAGAKNGLVQVYTCTDNDLWLQYSCGPNVTYNIR